MLDGVAMSGISSSVAIAPGTVSEAQTTASGTTSAASQMYMVQKGGGSAAPRASGLVMAASKARPSQPTIGGLIQYVSDLRKAMRSHGCSAGDRAALQKLLNSAVADLKSLTENKLQAAKQECDQQGWNKGSQERYLNVVQQAEKAYQAVDPKGPRATELKQLEKSLKSSIAKLKKGGGAKLQEAEKSVDAAYQNGVKNNWSEASRVKYLESVDQAIAQYRKVSPQNPRLAELRQVRDQVRSDIQGAAEEKLQAAEKQCTDSGGDLASTKNYLAAVKAAEQSYKLSGGGNSERAKQLHALEQQLVQKIKNPTTSTTTEISTANAQLDAAYKNCTQNGWSLESQTAYLKAAQAAVKAYEKNDPQNPRLTNLRQLQSDITRDVKKLGEDNIQAAYKDCTQNNWDLASQQRYLAAANGAVAAYEAANPNDPRLDTLRQLASDIQRDVNNLLGQGTTTTDTSTANAQLDAAYKNCTQNGWSLESQTAYLKAAQAAVKAYEKNDPQNPFLTNLRQLQSDITGDVKRVGEENIQKAYRDCTQNNWDLPSQQRYLAAAKAAVAAYETANPNDPRLVDLRQLASDIQRDVNNLMGQPA